MDLPEVLGQPARQPIQPLTTKLEAAFGLGYKAGRELLTLIKRIEMVPLSKYILVFSLLVPLFHAQAHGAEQQITSEAEAFSRVFDINPEGSPLEKEIFQQFRFGNKDRAAQAAYALRTNTAKESYLAFSEWYLVRWAVASNPNSYLAAIRLLMNDTSPDVSSAAIKTASAIPDFESPRES